MPAERPQRAEHTEREIEAVARAGWAYAEEREQRLHRDDGRTYYPVVWEDAHELDRVEYREYAKVMAAALDRARDARNDDEAPKENAERPT